MASTNFTSGTTITSPWLNDVNAVTYNKTFPDGTTGATTQDLASTASGKGAALVGYLPAGTSAVGSTVRAKLQESVSVFDFMTSAQIADAVSYGATMDVSSAFVAAFAQAKRVMLPAGRYRATFDMPDRGRLLGDGVLVSELIPISGAAYCIRLDARNSGTVVTRSYVNIENVRITNPNSVANCKGIYLCGTDVKSIMDYLTLKNVEISYFDKGIHVVGRMIGAYWERVNCTLNTRGFVADPDSVNVAFNLNTFVECYFNNSAAEGVRWTAISTTNKFIGCDFEGNNTLAVAGVAATHFVDAQNLSFDTCYWEANANALAVDTAVPVNNSISCRLTGTSITSMPTFRSAYMVGSGTNLLIDAQVLVGGVIEQSGINCSTGGFNIAVLSDANQGAAQQLFAVDASCSLSGKMLLQNATSQQFAAFVQQSDGMYYGMPGAIDLMRVSQFSVNTAGALTIPTPTNMIPGCELFIFVSGGGTVTVPAGLMVNGGAVSVASGTGKKFKALAYPAVGKFVAL